MHPRNIYKDNPPDFDQLATLYPNFSPFVSKSKLRPTIDWKNLKAVTELTKALLHKDFGVIVELPPNQLCPTVTSRLNYILWIEDLLALRNQQKKLKPEPTEKTQTLQIKGIDIGTGASCIYPLLGTATNQWNFLATDIDPISVEYATKNVKLNHWEEKIQVKLVEKEKMLCGVIGTERFDFCLSNPPFFETAEEKLENPKSTCLATDGELAVHGGEFGFISRMLEDSLVLKDQIRWYTSLIGRKVTVKKIICQLKEKGIENVRKTTFYQGNTTRWGIAWSFSKDGMEELQKKCLLKRFQGKKVVDYKTIQSTDFGKVKQFLEESLKTREVKHRWDEQKCLFIANLYRNSAWLQSFLGEEPVASTGSIGPIMPPTKVLEFQIKFNSFGNGELNISFLFSTETIDNLFSELICDLWIDLDSFEMGKK